MGSQQKEILSKNSSYSSLSTTCYLLNAIVLMLAIDNLIKYAFIMSLLKICGALGTAEGVQK